MGMAITNPVRSSVTKGLHEFCERRIAATDNHPVEQILSGEATVGGSSCFFELWIRSGRIIEGNVIKTLQLCQIVVNRFHFTENGFCKVLFLLLTVHALFKATTNTGRLRKACVLELRQCRCETV